MNLRHALEIFVVSHRGLTVPRALQLYKWSGTLLLNYVGDVPIGDITLHDLRLWRSHIAEHKSPRGGRVSVYTVRGHLRRIKRIFKWLAEEKYIETSPAGRLRLPKKPHIAPKDIPISDIMRLLEEAERSGPRDLAIVRLLAETGARAGGIAGLKVSDVDFVLRNGRAWARVVEKGNKERYIFFGEKTLNILRAYMVVRPTDQGDSLFIGRRGGLSPSGIYQMLKRLAGRNGVRRFNPHGFRHATARRLLRNGASIEDIAAILGHSSTGVTKEFYARWDAETVAIRHKMYGGLDD